MRGDAYLSLALNEMLAHAARAAVTDHSEQATRFLRSLSANRGAARGTLASLELVPGTGDEYVTP